MTPPVLAEKHSVLLTSLSTLGAVWGGESLINDTQRDKEPPTLILRQCQETPGIQAGVYTRDSLLSRKRVLQLCYGELITLPMNLSASKSAYWQSPP